MKCERHGCEMRTTFCKGVVVCPECMVEVDQPIQPPKALQDIVRLSREAGFYKGLLEGLLAQCRAEGNWYTISIPVYRAVTDALAKAEATSK